MLFTHVRQLFAPAEVCLFLVSARFPLCGCTFSETVLCSHDRQLNIRLFRHSIRPRTTSHFYAIRANADDWRVFVI